MTLATTFLFLYIFMFCINGMVYFIDTEVADMGLKTPLKAINQANMTSVAIPNTFSTTNSTGTLFNNVTAMSVTNSTTSTSSGTVNQFDADAGTGLLFWPIAVLTIFFGMITGSFIMDVFNMMGFPDTFGYIFMAIQGLFAVILFLSWKLKL